MGLRYSINANFTLANAGGNADLLELLPADNRPVKLIRLKLGQTSELAEAAEEQLRITIHRFKATVTSGSGGASPNIERVKRKAGDSAFSAEVNNSTVATTSGDDDVLEDWTWNLRGTPLEVRWDDEKDQYDFEETEALIIRCDSTPADDITFSITVIVEEE